MEWLAAWPWGLLLILVFLVLWGYGDAVADAQKIAERVRDKLHTERLAAIEKGLPPPDSSFDEGLLVFLSDGTSGSDASQTRARGPEVEEIDLPVVVEAASDPLRDRALLDCIERLPDAHRAAIRLHYWLGETVTEIAGLLGTRPGTVKSWLFRARDLVGQCLKSKGVGM